MEIRPILSALMRSKVAMILIGLQVALTLAIVCNALFIIGERLRHMARPSGMNEADTFWFGSNGFGQGYNAKVVQQSDLALLRQLPGVADAAPTNSVPMSDGGWGTGLSLAPHQKKSTADTTIYLVDDHAISARSARKLVAGRNFKPEEIESLDFGDQPAAAGRDHLQGARRQDVSGRRCDRQAGLLRPGPADDDDHRRSRSPAGAVDVERRRRERERSCRRSCRTAIRRATSCAPSPAAATRS